MTLLLEHVQIVIWDMLFNLEDVFSQQMILLFLTLIVPNLKTMSVKDALKITSLGKIDFVQLLILFVMDIILKMELVLDALQVMS